MPVPVPVPVHCLLLPPLMQSVRACVRWCWCGVQLCGDEFDTGEQFTEHMRAEHPTEHAARTASASNANGNGGDSDDDDDHMCEECGDEFDSRVLLAQHIAAAHNMAEDGGEDDDFMCEACGDEFGQSVCVRVRVRACLGSVCAPPFLPFQPLPLLSSRQSFLWLLRMLPTSLLGVNANGVGVRVCVVTHCVHTYI